MNRYLVPCSSSKSLPRIIFNRTMNTYDFQSHKKTLKSIKNIPRTLHNSGGCLAIAFLFVPFFVIYVTCGSSPGFLSRTTVKENCPSGGVYVYDLPPEFNDGLLVHNCTDLNPWRWQCGIVTNHGRGAPAGDLRGILPENLSRSWYRTNQFSLELIFHDRILNHRCRTMEPESATAFYIPFYAGLAVGKYLWNNDTSKRDHRCRMLLRWMASRKYWRRFNGSDHFIAIGRITWDFRRLTDPEKLWGSSFLNMPEMRTVSRFIIERNTGDAHDVGVPYPTGFHPETKGILNQWQSFARDYNRSILFTFVGANRKWISRDFRALLFSYCQRESGSCRLVDCDAVHCSTGSPAVLEAFLGSEFCLQPKGDSYTRRSVFDCMLAGSVPVFFWNRTAYGQYEWFLPRVLKSYSVFIEHEAAANDSGIIKRVLMGYSKEEIKRKRDKVIEIIPRIVYGVEGLNRDFRDAFDIAFDGVLGRIKELDKQL